MKFISHRGNLDKKIINEENKPEKIIKCISLGFDVEIDIWCVNNILYLGHDSPEEEVSYEFLEKNKEYLWIHAKNIECLSKLKNFNCFWHQEDDYTLTSFGHIWVYPGKNLIQNSIAVTPEITNYSKQELKKCYGICSDKISFYRKLIKS